MAYKWGKRRMRMVCLRTRRKTNPGKKNMKEKSKAIPVSCPRKGEDLGGTSTVLFGLRAAPHFVYGVDRHDAFQRRDRSLSDFHSHILGLIHLFKWVGDSILHGYCQMDGFSHWPCSPLSHNWPLIDLVHEKLIVLDFDVHVGHIQFYCFISLSFDAY